MLRLLNETNAQMTEGYYFCNGDYCKLMSITKLQFLYYYISYCFRV